MKKRVFIILTALCLLALTACVQTGTAEIAEGEAPAEEGENLPDEAEDMEWETILPVEDAPVEGGWELADSPVITPDIQSVLDRAMERFSGARLEPIAYIGSQVVAGSNYCLLCKMTPEEQDAEAAYTIVYLYEDLEGRVEITDFLNSAVEVPEEGLMGGWSMPETPELTEEACAALDIAVQELAGVAYTPVALVGTQVVAGMNYCILCQTRSDVPGEPSGFSLVYVYADLQGDATLTDTVEFRSLDG